jgi:hypothetical protein
VIAVPVILTAIAYRNIETRTDGRVSWNTIIIPLSICLLHLDAHSHEKDPTVSTKLSRICWCERDYDQSHLIENGLVGMVNKIQLIFSI